MGGGQGRDRGNVGAVVAMAPRFAAAVILLAVVMPAVVLAVASCGGGEATSTTVVTPTASPPTGPATTGGGQATEGEAQQKARDFVGLLASGSFAEAETRMDDTMRKALPQNMLADVWQGIESQTGAFGEVQSSRIEQSGAYTVVYVTGSFGTHTLDVKVVFDAAGKVAGLFFVPTAAAGGTGTGTSYEPPAYVVADAFSEQEVTVGSGTWALRGTLSLPKGTTLFPAVVLVHGSGPQDRDESIGPNKPFRDLAGGLASRGVAVLRYEKRTKAYAQQMAASVDQITPKEETIDDALAAVKLLGNHPEIDPGRIFVLGHSLGGTLAPRIGAASADVAGLVVLAGTARPLEDVILDQTTYLLGLQTGLSAAERTAQIDEVRGQVAKVKDPALSADTPAAELPLGIPAAYWLDLRGYDPPAAAAGLAKPVLVLQGGRDYQVTTADYDLWRAALAGRAGADFKLYPDLNHLFMTGSGKSIPAEYESVGHVAAPVVADIASWIAAH